VFHIWLRINSIVLCAWRCHVLCLPTYRIALCGPIIVQEGIYKAGVAVTVCVPTPSRFIGCLEHHFRVSLSSWTKLQDNTWMVRRRISSESITIHRSPVILPSTLLLLLILWRYSPGWPLSSITIRRQASRSLALSFHSFIPIFLRYVDTSSSLSWLQRGLTIPCAKGQVRPSTLYLDKIMSQ
jgi:hypothetical protein